MDIEAVLEAFRDACPDHTFEMYRIPIDENIIGIQAACLRDVVAVLGRTFSIHHLSTITGQDTGTTLELLYHFWSGRGLTLRVGLPYDDARIDSLTDIIPGADFYERETAEMLGVTFEGHPRSPRSEADGFEHFLLPEDWWVGPPPLRKEQAAEEDES